MVNENAHYSFDEVDARAHITNDGGLGITLAWRAKKKIFAGETTTQAMTIPPESARAIFEHLMDFYVKNNDQKMIKLMREKVA